MPRSASFGNRERAKRHRRYRGNGIGPNEKLHRRTAKRPNTNSLAIPTNAARYRAFYPRAATRTCQSREKPFLSSFAALPLSRESRLMPLRALRDESPDNPDVERPS